MGSTARRYRLCASSRRGPAAIRGRCEPVWDASGSLLTLSWRYRASKLRGAARVRLPRTAGDVPGVTAALSRPVLCRPVPSRPVPCRPIPSRPVPSHAVPSHPTLSCPGQDCFAVCAMFRSDAVRLIVCPSVAAILSRTDSHLSSAAW